MRRVRHCILVTAFALGVVTPSARAAVPVNTTPPAVSGYAQVASQLTCVAGQWTGATSSSTFVWLRNGTPIVPATGSTYTAQAADIGQPLACQETRSNADGPTSATSAPTVAVVPRATVRITRYSPSLRGNIGVATSGVDVQVKLVRGPAAAPITVAQNSAATDTNGDWSLTLPAGMAPANDMDSLVLTYTGGSGTLPPDASYSLYANPNAGWLGALAGAAAFQDGTNITVSGLGTQNCATELALTENLTTNVPLATGTGYGTCTASFAPAVTAADRFDLTRTFPSPALTGYPPPALPQSTLVTSVQTQLVGVGALYSTPTGFQSGSGAGSGAAPMCLANLISREAACWPIPRTGTFTLKRLAGGTTTAGSFNLSPDSDSASLLRHATVDQVVPGDALQLIAGTSGRVISELHVGVLRIDFAQPGGPAASGSCQAGKAFQAGYVCALNGTFAIADGEQAYSALYPLTITDDRSGGGTAIVEPQVGNTAPMDWESVWSTQLRLYADPSDSFSSSFTPQPALKPTVSAKVTLRGQNTPTYDGPVDAENGTLISGLQVGRYDVLWKATDSNGDTYTLKTQFIVQGLAKGDGGATGEPGAPGTPGTPGPAGARGPAGPASKVTCQVKKDTRTRAIKVTCKVTTVKSTARARLITSGQRTVAFGSGRHGTVRLTTTHTLRSGQYQLILTTGHGWRATTSIITVRLSRDPTVYRRR